jgi:hypothetical protein
MMRILAVAAVAAALGGCVSNTATYVKKTGGPVDRYERAIDQLDCTKAKLVAYKSALRSYTAADPYARNKAQAASNAAFARCAENRGYRRVK